MDEADIDLNPRIGPTYMRRGKQLVVLTPGKNVKRDVAGGLNARAARSFTPLPKRKKPPSSSPWSTLYAGRTGVPGGFHLVLDNFIIHKSRQTLRHLHGLGGGIALHSAAIFAGVQL